MKTAMKHLNKFNQIINSSKPTISKEQIQKAQDEIIEFNCQWNVVKDENDAYNEFTVENMDVWKEPIGRKNEQSIEAVQAVSNESIHLYDNFKGIPRTKHFINNFYSVYDRHGY